LSRRQHSLFEAELRAMSEADDDFLNPALRADLVQLANDPDIEQIWANIEKARGKQSKLVMRLFIREILIAKRLAETADDWPDELTHAKEAERLARFLKGSGRLPPPLPMIGMPALVASLEKVALMLREQAKMSRIHRSREDIDGSRQYTAFMRLVSLQMLEMFGRWFDNEVADLTNIFFPRAMVTNESVRATRRSTTSKGRSGKKVGQAKR
jgi:hypothetical protein